MRISCGEDVLDFQVGHGVGQGVVVRVLWFGYYGLGLDLDYYDLTA